MNPTVLGGAASLLLVVLWWSGRRRPVQLLRSTDASAIAALNRAQIVAVRQPLPTVVTQPSSESEGQCPAEALVDLPPSLVLRRLSLALSQSPSTRLAALRQARVWGHRASLPLLLRGLRDPDPAVVLEAALAMERFRGRSAVAQPAAEPLPRNVARNR
jgi:hypothetical protein